MNGQPRSLEDQYPGAQRLKPAEPVLFLLPRYPNPVMRQGQSTEGTKQVQDPIEVALAAIRFGPDGLVPAIAQQYDTAEILMLAWMNREAVQASLDEGRACYWSRSRAKLWRKGETSGQVQLLRELRLDCDGDTVLLLVDQQGVACHTGRRSCFFRAWRDGDWALIAKPEVSPEIPYPARTGG
jgi:phosphoribosyl-AMP cyclohydrolase